jgi:hypothetical protein
MVFHMKTTINISDKIYHDIKQEAARRGVTMGYLIEAALRSHLQERERKVEFPALPSYPMGELVDIANRDALYDAMERD